MLFNFYIVKCAVIFCCSCPLEVWNKTFTHNHYLNVHFISSLSIKDFSYTCLSNLDINPIHINSLQSISYTYALCMHLCDTVHIIDIPCIHSTTYQICHWGLLQDRNDSAKQAFVVIYSLAANVVHKQIVKMSQPIDLVYFNCLRSTLYKAFLKVFDRSFS